jgi:hypothetical protein
MGDKLVKINVGGKRFMTSYSTINARGENFLSMLIQKDIEGTMLSTKDEKGYTFIDRDGDLFSIVLNYLRTGEVFIPTNIPKRLVAIEFEFYGMHTDFVINIFYLHI